ncbi:MAG: hypothetical protein PHQ22_09090 [Sulfuricurvum sp.]|nr:hypothetical protein [Sulfuricurvum sp.]
MANEIVDHFETDTEELARHDEIAAKIQAYVDEGLAHLNTPEKIYAIVEAKVPSYYEKFLNTDDALSLCGVQRSDIDNAEKFKTIMRELLSQYVELSIGEDNGSMKLADKLTFSAGVQIFFGDVIYDKTEEQP